MRDLHRLTRPSHEALMLETLLIVASLAVWCLGVWILVRQLLSGGRPDGGDAPLPRKPHPPSLLRDWQAWLQSGGEGRDLDRRQDGP